MPLKPLPLIQYDPDSGQLTVATKPLPTKPSHIGHPLLADPCGCLSGPVLDQDTCFWCGHLGEVDPRRLVVA